MSVGRIHQAERLVGSLLEERGLAALPDDQLLEHFVRARDDAAFAALVRRHGPMVLGVCRGILRDSHDAEDAFQATFVVLACRADKVRQQTSVGSFLYGVACRVALKARERAARRRTVERAAALLRVEAEQPNERPALSEQLHDELGRLPERYRQVLVLCQLEGKTQDQAARELGCPAGSVSRHLGRARELLRERLTARGTALSTTALAVALAESAQAAVSPTLAESTLRTAALHAAGLAQDAAVPVIALAREVLQSMARYHVKALTAALLLLGVIAAGTTLIAEPRTANLSAQARKEPPAVNEPPATANKPIEPPKEDPTADRFGDPLPAGAVVRFGTIRLRVGGQVRAITYSPDGKLLATVGDDGLLHIWSSANGKELARAAGLLAHSNSVAFSPDGKAIASVGAARAILLFDLPNLSEEVRAPLTLGHERLSIPCKGNVPSLLLFVADGKSLLSGEIDGCIRLHNAVSGEEIRVFGAIDKAMHGFAVAPDGKTLAVACPHKPVVLWNVATGEKLGQMPGLESILRLAFSPDSRRLAAGIDNSDGIRLWDVATRKEVRSFIGQKDSPLSRGIGSIAQDLAFTPDGKALVSVGSHGDDRVRVWEVASDKELRQFRNGSGEGGRLAVSPDGRVVAVTGIPNRVRIWELATGKELHTERGLLGRIDALAVSPDSRVVALGTFDGEVRLFEGDTGREVRSFPVEPHSISDLAFAPDGKQLLTAVAYNPARLWDLGTGKEVRSFPGAQGSVRGVFRVSFAPDGKLLALGVPEAGVPLVDPATGKLVRRIEDRSTIDRVVFAPDGRTLAGGGFDKALHLWDVASGKELWVSRLETSIASIAFSPDGKLLATGDYVGDTRLWNAANGEFLRGLGGAGSAARMVAFAPDGRLVASAGDSHDVLLLEVASGTEVRRLTGHSGPVWNLAFTPDGRSLVTGSFDTTGLVWDMTGRAFAKKPAQPLGDADLEKGWVGLGSARGDEGYAAVWALTRSGREAIPFLEGKLRGTALPDAKRMARLLAELDDDQFEVRERASAALARLGKVVEPDLKEALAQKPSAEAKSRLEALLEKLGAADGDPRLRGLRLLTVLEHVASPEALDLLKRLAEKGGLEEVREGARSALKRAAAIRARD